MQALLAQALVAQPQPQAQGAQAAMLAGPDPQLNPQAPAQDM
jgi:hypothetical protein